MVKVDNLAVQSGSWFDPLPHPPVNHLRWCFQPIIALYRRPRKFFGATQPHRPCDWHARELQHMWIVHAPSNPPPQTSRISDTRPVPPRPKRRARKPCRPPNQPCTQSKPHRAAAHSAGGANPCRRCAGGSPGGPSRGAMRKARELRWSSSTRSNSGKGKAGCACLLTSMRGLNST